MEDGYEFFARRQLVTLFSAPNYCGDYDNAGGMMTIDQDLMCSFQVERERERDRETDYQCHVVYYHEKQKTTGNVYFIN